MYGNFSFAVFLIFVCTLLMDEWLSLDSWTHNDDVFHNDKKIEHFKQFDAWCAVDSVAATLPLLHWTFETKSCSLAIASQFWVARCAPLDLCVYYAFVISVQKHCKCINSTWILLKQKEFYITLPEWFSRFRIVRCYSTPFDNGLCRIQPAQI